MDMKTLLLCDDHWHPGNVPINGIAPLKAKGYSFDVIKDAGDFDPDMLNAYDTVMLCKCNHKSQSDNSPWLTEEIQESFIGYVHDGGGLLVIHNGTVFDERTHSLSRLVGCRFTFHPNNCPVTAAPIKPHPITDGVGMFCEIDEHYRLEILTGDIDVIIASYSAGQGDESKYDKEPYFNTSAWIGAAGFVREHGKGRVCTLTPGHLPNVWLNPHFQKTLENALLWCGKKK